MAKHCNTYRVYTDIEDGWLSLKDVVKYYGDNGRSFAKDSGPGNWNDPDQVNIISRHALRILQYVTSRATPIIM